MERYTVVMADNLSDLRAAVEAKLRLGWQCQGGVTGNHISNFFQAMVK